MTTVLFAPSKCLPPRRGAVNLDGIKLAPGAPTHLSEDELAKLKAHPSFARYEKWGAVQILGTESTKPPTDTSKLENLSTFDIKGGDGEKGAEDIVAATTDVALLNKWLKAETRTTLKKIISDRVKELGGGA